MLVTNLDLDNMKTLQNNFTTPEQSKQLLELGVPSDSADCYLTRFGIYKDWEVKILNNVKYLEIAISNQKYCLPCWSVGRLIEIYEICFGGYFNSRYFGHTLMEDVLLKIEDQIDSIDFSKLEE